VFDKIRRRGRRIVEVNSSKVLAAIPNAGKTTGEFWQRTGKNADLVKNYIQKLDWKVRENSQYVIFPPGSQ